jgi:hypothetical protein
MCVCSILYRHLEIAIDAKCGTVWYTGVNIKTYYIYSNTNVIIVYDTGQHWTVNNLANGWLRGVKQPDKTCVLHIEH